MHVVHVAVAVVVDVVVGDLPLVDPDVGGEIGVQVVDTGVDDADHDLGRAGVEIPGLGDRDVRSGRSPGLSLVPQAPEKIERRVVRGLGHAPDPVGLDVLDGRIVGPALQRLLHREALELPAGGPDAGEDVELGAELRGQLRAGGDGRVLPELDEDLARGVGGEGRVFGERGGGEGRAQGDRD